MGEKVPQPRLCHIVKSSDFDGYGFNLHSEKNKSGQYIGQVDPRSPADAAGLKEGDRIIEVNGTNINNENHKQVVQRIKADPNQTRLLVVDNTCDMYHQERDIIVTGDLPYVLFISNEENFDHSDADIESDEEKIDTTMQTAQAPPPYTSVATPVSQQEDEEDGGRNMRVTREDSLLSDRTLSNRSSVSSGKVPNSLSSGSNRSTPSPINFKEGGLDLPHTAKEMREILAGRKKKDPRIDEKMDLKKKYEIIESLKRKGDNKV